jgi:hypothetical protein
LHPSWINAYRAFQAGLGRVEVFRVRGDNTYKYVALDSATAGVREADSVKTIADPSIALRYAGVPPALIDGNVLLLVGEDISAEEGYNDEGFPPAVRIKLYQATEASYLEVREALKEYDTTTEPPEGPGPTKAEILKAFYDALTPIESYEGFTQLGFQLDGSDAFVGTKIQNNSQLLQFVNNNSESFDTTTFAVVFDPVDFTKPADIDSDAIALSYPEVFSDIEIAKATILIDPGTTTVGGANAFLAAAAASVRSDLVAITGYPTSLNFDKDSILTYKQGLTPNQFGAFYATRELVTINHVNYTSNGAGTIAGRIAAVANSSNVNQLPSAKTWGAFGGVVTESLSFKDVLALHEKGVNSVYASVDGARIFGIRSLHVRAMSYYAKFNVSRVAARILRYGFNVALNAIHVGNTGALKASVQNLLDADLTRLKASGDIRSESSVLCAESNNKDVDTMGGEILIIDYEIYFIKLVERVKFTITATDNSVAVSQG